MARCSFVVPLCGEAKSTSCTASQLSLGLAASGEEHWCSSLGASLTAWPLAKHWEGLTF